MSLRRQATIGRELSALPPVLWGPEKRRQQSQEAISKVINEVSIDLDFMEEVFDEFFRRDFEEAKTHYIAVVISFFSLLGGSSSAWPKQRRVHYGHHSQVVWRFKP